MRPSPVTPEQAIAGSSSLTNLSAHATSRGRKERIVFVVTFLSALLSIVTTLGIIGVLARETFLFFTEVSPKEFLLGTKWAPTFAEPSFGVLPLVNGTLMITIGSALISVPLGLLVAIYLSEYASARLKRLLKPALELLAGIPTVVYGYFALFTITPLLKRVIPDLQVFNALSGAIVVGIMTLPLMSSLCEDALSAVPKSLRDAGLALGSTKYEVIRKVAVPSAFSGIMAAIVLAISRAVGETMAVSLAAGMNPNLTLDPRKSIETMTAYIVQISHGDTPEGSIAMRTIFAVGALLFLSTLLLNLVARKFVRRFREAYG